MLITMSDLYTKYKKEIKKNQQKYTCKKETSKKATLGELKELKKVKEI
jgi:hypothetical protein